MEKAPGLDRVQNKRSVDIIPVKVTNLPTYWYHRVFYSALITALRPGLLVQIGIHALDSSQDNSGSHVANTAGNYLFVQSNTQPLLLPEK